jgi:hypothetical protein
MARRASGIAAAELRVVHSRRNLRDGLRRLGLSVSRPRVLAAAVVLGALLARSLADRSRTDALATTLAAALMRRFARQLF